MPAIGNAIVFHSLSDAYVQKGTRDRRLCESNGHAEEHFFRTQKCAMQNFSMLFR
jgi:hypothetical protein